MKTATIILLLLFVCSLSAQKYNFRHAIMPASLAIVSGACWGMHETCVHHPDRLPDSWNAQWWDGRISWTNKGTGLWGSTFGAFGSDAKHTFGTLHRYSLFASGLTVTIGQKRPTWHYFADMAISFAAFSVGFHTVYSIAFHK